MDIKQLKFCGTRRKEKLDQLTEIFGQIADVASSIKSSQTMPKAPIHRLIVLKGGRGRGKMRLGMEVYRHLQDTTDSHNYWPKADRLYSGRQSIMPEIDKCDYQAPLPFLWWGLSVQQDSKDTLFGGLPSLLPHLVTMRVANRRAKRFQEAGIDIADLATDLSIEVGNAAVDMLGESIGLGAIKRVGQSLYKIGSIVQRANQDMPTPQQEADGKVAKLADEILADLDQLLNPSSPHFAERPAVILIDDAQFADFDAPMVDFIKKLVEISAVKRWPLMLILTHWDTEFNDHRNEAGEPVAKSQAALAIDELLQQPAYGLNSALLPGDLQIIDLSENIENLDEALKDQFGGINDDAISQILEKSGDNPRKLQQIMLEMAHNKSWFINKDPGHDLTEQGRKEVLALSSLDIDKIAYQRLTSAPHEIRRACGLASMFGNRFVVDLVDRLSQQHWNAPCRDALQVSERIYHFTNDILTGDDNDIGQFSDPIYHQAAKHYRNNGDDGDDWHDEEVIFASMDKMLETVINDPRHFETLKLEDHAFCLRLMADRMAASDNPKAGLMLAMLTSVENKRGNFEGGYQAAADFISGLKEHKWTTDALPDFTVNELTATFTRLGNLENLLIFTKAIKSYWQQQVDENPAELQNLRNLSVSHNSIGDIQAAQGDLDQALISYQNDLDIAKKLAKSDPTNSEWQRDLSASHSKIGNIQSARGGLDQALNSFQNSFDIAQKLTKSDPTNSEWQRDLSVSHNKIGDIQVAQGKLDQALISYQNSLNIRKKLAKFDPTNSQWQRDLSVSYNKIGNIQTAQGKLDQALTSYQNYLDIAQKLAKSDPTNSEWQRDLSVSHEKVGDIQVAQEKLDLALNSFQNSLSIRKLLAESDPTNSAWQRDLSVSHNKIGDIEFEQGDLDQAHNSFQNSLSIRKELAKSDPTNSEWQRDLSVSHNKTGDIQAAQGDLDQALNSYQNDLDIRKKFAKPDPTNSVWQRDLITLHVRISQCVADPVSALEEAYSVAVALKETGRLAPRDHGMIDVLKKRLDDARGG